MRVVLVSRFPVHIDKPRGGVETATVGLARALILAGIEDLHVVTLEHGVESVTKEFHEGIQVHRLRRSRWPMIADVFFGPSTVTLNRYLEVLKPDIVHFQETWGFGVRRCRFPSVFTVHGFDSLNLPTEKAVGGRLRAALWRLAERMGLRAQTHVISIAPYVTKEIRPLTEAKIHEIWNSLDQRYFELEVRPEPNRVLFLGWINPRKNPLTLVEAAGLLRVEFPDLQVDLCGAESDSEYATLVRQKIAELKLTKHVHLLGSLTQTEVKERLIKATVLVLPSLQENAPMVIAEAMAAGVPVIASNLCGVPDMVTNNKSGLLLDDPHDAKALAVALERMLSDQPSRTAMVMAAKDEAFKKFHPQEVAKATISVYDEVISTHKRWN